MTLLRKYMQKRVYLAVLKAKTHIILARATNYNTLVIFGRTTGKHRIVCRVRDSQALLAK